MLLNLANTKIQITYIIKDKENTKSDSNHIGIKPYPNPTGIFRVLGLYKLKALFDKYLFFPSTTILFNGAAKKILYQKIQHDLNNNRSVSVVTCAPPHGTTLCGLYLKKRFPKINWLVDWQDLWTYDESYFHRTPKLYKKRLIKLEQKILQSSDLNITTNNYAADVLKNHYNLPSNKIISIVHPYNTEELAAVSTLNNNQAASNNRAIKIGFLGTLSKPPKVPGDRILEAIDSAQDSGLNVEFHIFGDPTKLTHDLVKKMRNNGVIIHERMPHLDSLKKISECDILLITLSDLPNCRVIMHAKLPHYLIINRPILAFVPKKSFVAQVVNETNTGIVIDTDKDWGLELVNILRSFKDKNLNFNRNEQAIRKYSWENVSKQWNNVINKAPLKP